MKRGRLLAGLVILFAIFLCVGCVQPDDPTEKTEKVTVSVQTDGNGTLTATPDGEVEKGTSVTVEIAADEGYELASFTVNEADKLAEVSQNKYTFTANEDTVVEASFRALVYTVTGIVQTADGNLDGLEVVFMSGLDRYPAKVAADGSYSVSVPSGVYGAVFTHEYFAEVAKKNAVEVPEEVKALAEERWQAKKSKNWARADELRAEIDKLGFAVKDGKDGYEIVSK